MQWIASVILAGVFATAALPKINDVAKFALNIDQYQILPSAVVTLLALCLPWLELVVGLGLLIPQVQKPAAGYVPPCYCYLRQCISARYYVDSRSNAPALAKRAPEAL